MLTKLVSCARIVARFHCTVSCSDDRSITSENINDHYTEGQEVDVRIMEVNTVNNKMSLSMLPPVEEVGELFDSTDL